MFLELQWVDKDLVALEGLFEADSCRIHLGSNGVTRLESTVARCSRNPVESEKHKGQ